MDGRDRQGQASAEYGIRPWAFLEVKIGQRGLRRRHVAWMLLAALLLVFQVLATWQPELHKQIFREGGQAFVDRGGTEADTHIDRLETLWAMESCSGSWQNCIIDVLERGDRHHPPFTNLSAALWNLIFGESIFASVQLNLIWLMVLIYALYTMGAKLAGEKAGWIALLLGLSMPLLLGPARVLHQDMPMVALMLLFATALMHFAEKPAFKWALLAIVSGALTLFTKWESILGLAGVGFGFSVYALRMPLGWLKAPLTGILSAAFIPLAWQYLTVVYSRSFLTRPAMWWLESPSRLKELLSAVVATATISNDIHAEVGQKDPSDVLERIQFYLSAMPAATVGLLTTLLLLVGMVLIWRSRDRMKTLLLTLPWAGSAFGAVLVLVHEFADDRFIHLFITPLVLWAAVGLATLRGPWIVAGVAVVSILQIWDLSVAPSPLPHRVLITIPLAGHYEYHPRTIALRPDIAKGHAVWVRPQQRYDSDLESVQKTMDILTEMGAKNALLSLDCGGLCGETSLWHFAALTRRKDISFTVNPQYGELHRPEDMGDRCASVREKELAAQFKAGTVLVADRVEALEPEDFNWARASCGLFSKPAELGLRIDEVREIPTHTQPLWLLSLAPIEPDQEPVVPAKADAMEIEKSTDGDGAEMGH